MTHGREKSDPAIVAGKSANKDRRLSAKFDGVKGGGRKGTRVERGMRRTPSRESMFHGLDREASREGAKG